MKLRKKDYIIFYVLSLIMFVLNVMKPVEINVIFIIVIFATFPALLLGTITNFLFRKK